MFPEQLLDKMRSGASRRLLVNRSNQTAYLREAIEARVYYVDSRELALCLMADQLYFMLK